MLSKVTKLISIVFAIIWMIVVFVEYWQYNPNYAKALELFQYYDLLILVIGIGAFLTWYIKKPRKKPITYINGLSIFFGVLVLDALVVNRFYSKVGGLGYTGQGLFSHLGHIIGVSICIFLVYLLVRVLGQVFTSIFPVKISSVDLPLIEVALGAMVFTFLLFFLGLVGLLNGFVIIPIGLLIFAVYWRYSYRVIKNTLIRPVQLTKDLSIVGIFSFLCLSLFIALNFAQILRPFPIGSDSLRLYVNLPTLLSEYGSLVAGNQPYNWSLIMSTGLTVFGRTDVVLGLSFLGGILSLWALYRLSRKWLDVNYALLVLLLFYTIPMVSFLSYMDMKIDMALMFVTLSILLLFYNWIKPATNEVVAQRIDGPGILKARMFFKHRIPLILKKNALLVLIGLLSGFAFGIKLTVLLFFLALLTALWFYKGGKLAFLASFLLCVAVVLILQLDAQAGLRQFHSSVDVLQWSLLIAAIGIIVYLFIKKKDKLQSLLRYSLIIGCFFALPVIPWLGKNFAETGKISVTALINGKKASPAFKVRQKQNKRSQEEVIIPGIYQLPDVPKPTGKKDNKKKSKRSSDQSEDLHRFLGYEVTPAKYLSLPYDVLVKTNIAGFFTDVGFVILLLFPLLFLIGSKKIIDWKTAVEKLSFIVISSLLLIVSIPSAYLNSNKLTTTSDGLAQLQQSEASGFLHDISASITKNLLEIYAPINDWFLAITPNTSAITYPMLILLFLLVLIIVYNRVKHHSRTTRSIIALIATYFFLWWILSSGAPWYGMLLFSLPLIFLFKSILPVEINGHDNQRKLDIFTVTKKYLMLTVCVIWVFFAIVYRSSNYEPVNEQRAKNIYYPAIMDYQMGKINEKKVMDNHFPDIRQQVKIINRDKKAKVFMVGSPFNFFIDKNDTRVLYDTFLEFYDQLIKEHRTKEEVIKRLKAEGFTYIVFDLNIFSYDVTPDKSLTRKFVQFMNSLYGNPGVELMATNRKIKLYDTGEEINAVFQDKGSITKSGTFGIFKIK